MKPIDLLKMKDAPKCEHCVTKGCTDNGISLISCNFTYGGWYLNLTATNGEPCTPDDWKVCPLNPDYKKV